MRSSQRCSESFSCPEKYRRTMSFVLPLLAPAAALDAAFAFGLVLSTLAFSAFGSDFGCSGSASAAAVSPRSSLNWSFLSSRKASFQRSSLWRACWAFFFLAPKKKKKKGLVITGGCDGGGGQGKKRRGRNPVFFTNRERGGVGEGGGC